MQRRDDRIRWGDARAALRSLQRDPERSELVFEIVRALSGRQQRRIVERIRRDPEGARMLRQRPHFDADHVDLAALERLPRGTFGRAFARWMSEQAFEPGMEARDWTGDDELAYVGRRLSQVHDLWHVLSGYNRDPLGELGMLAFSVGQTATRGFVFILSNVAWRAVCNRWRDDRRLGSPLLPYLWRAYRAGRRARYLPALVLEERFGISLADVRRELGIEPLTASFHPGALPPIGSSPLEVA